MQCVSCQFENMPGTEFCGRCGTSMVLADIDINPPRATRLGKAWRRATWPLSRLAREASRIRTEARTIGSQIMGVVPTADVLMRMLIPGWPQFYNGQKAIGRLLLLTFFLLATAGALFYGTAWGSMFLGFAFGVHVWSVLQAAGPADARMLLKLRRGLGVAISLAIVVYMPLIRALSYPFDARIAMADQGAISSGDVVLVHHLRAPRIGDVVIYALDYRQYDLGNHTMAYLGGPQMERIIAGAGDRVEVSKGVLRVNGRLAAVQPMDLRNMPESLTITVPAGSFVVFPALYTGPAYNAAIRAVVSSDLYVIPADKVSGVAYWRHQPLSRWGPLP